jgi:hypothetical protein
VAQTLTTHRGTVVVPILAIGLGIQGGFHSPAWLSDDTITVNTNPSLDTGVAVNFSSNDVSYATVHGGYLHIDTISCSTYANAGSSGATVTGTPCGIGQAFTTWQGFPGGSDTVDNTGSCGMVRLPVPAGTLSVVTPFGTQTGLAPYAQQYVDMLQAVLNHISARYTFASVNVIKLGAALAGQDSEMTLLGGNRLGTTNEFVYPPEADGSTLGTQVCPGPASTLTPTSPYSYAWQGLYSYNPRIVEETWEYIANSAAAIFGASASGSVLLNLDLHNDTSSTFPFIPFQETNSNTSAIYGATSYLYSADGPTLQDDLVFCDLIGAPTNGRTVNIYPPGGGSTPTVAGPYYAGFPPAPIGPANHCLTGTFAHAHQPLSLSLANNYRWGVETDGLVPETSTSVAGIYAQGVARSGLELSWGTNGGNNGATCGYTVSGSTTTTYACNSATSQTSICGTGVSGDTLTCSEAMEAMLDSGTFTTLSSAPYGQSNPTLQHYVVASADLCNPYLWLGIGHANQAIAGLDLKTSDLGTITVGGNHLSYQDCTGNTGMFDSSGNFSE